MAIYWKSKNEAAKVFEIYKTEVEKNWKNPLKWLDPTVEENIMASMTDIIECLDHLLRFSKERVSHLNTLLLVLQSKMV